MRNVCVVGLGYVGLTLAAHMASRDVCVFGVDQSTERLAKLHRREPPFYEPQLSTQLERHIGRGFRIGPAVPSEAFDAFVIAVGTPVGADLAPDLSHVRAAAESIAPHLGERPLVILRSTVPVGTSRRVVLPLLQERAPDVRLAFCPERTVEGRALQELQVLPQVIGGLDEDSVFAAELLFSRLTQTTVKVSSLEVAELTKLADNCYRDVRFAFANEFSTLCKHLGVDPLETIRAANTGYSRTDIPPPGFVGGPCLSKDPYVLLDSIPRELHPVSVVRAARETNLRLVDSIAAEVGALIRERDLVEHGKIFITGFAFKGRPATDDLRDSPTVRFIERLRQIVEPRRLFGHDFVASDESIAALGLTPCALADGFRDADLVLVMNNHEGYGDLDLFRLTETMPEGSILLDCWHVLRASGVSDRVHYRGLFGCTTG